MKAVTAAAFTPNGAYVVTASEDSTAKVWRYPSGVLIRTLRGHRDKVTSVAITADGRRVVTGSHDGTAKVWDVATGRQVQSFGSDREGVTAVAFLNGGADIVTAGWSRTARLWHVATGETQTLSRHDGAILSADISPDGRYLLTGGTDRMVRIWDIASHKEIRACSSAKGNIAAVAFSPDGRTVATGHGNHTVTLWNPWDASGCREIDSLGNHHDEVSFVRFSNDGRTMITADIGSVKLWDLTSRPHHVVELEGSGAVETPDHKLLLFGDAADKAMTMIDFRTLQQVGTFPPATVSNASAVRTAGFSADRRFLLVGSYTTALWDLQSGSVAQTYPLSDGIFSPDGKRILAVGMVVASRTGPVEMPIQAAVYDTETEAQLSSVAFQGTLATTIFLPDSNSYVVRGDGKISRYSAVSGEPLAAYEEQNLLGGRLTATPDGCCVLAAGFYNDQSAQLYNLTNGSVVRSLKGHSNYVESVAVSADGRWALTGSADNTARLWKLSNGTELTSYIGHTNTVNTVAFAPDTKRVVTGGADGVAMLWQTGSGALLQTLIGHEGGVAAAAFDPTGKYVVTGGDDGTARIWDTQSGHELCSLMAFSDGTWVVKSPDGRFDTNRLEDLPFLNWFVADDPLTALPFETFMRDYYEPRLLPRILAGESLPPLPSIEKLNRVQPIASIVSIERVASSADLVNVCVAVESKERIFTRDGKPGALVSGAYDLRLFRDGQIVGQWPEPKPPGAAPDNQEAELLAWRAESQIQVDPKNGRATHTFTVTLPRRPDAKQTDFSAYAFNSDRVKSTTTHKVFDLPSDLPRRKGRAWIITMGVNSSESPAWDLHFAANDARALRTTLEYALGRRDDFESVVSVSLISDSAHPDADAKPATKDNLCEVLDQLAGRSEDPEGRIHKATPEDLVLISFSGHGYADGLGGFYLIPHDIGAGNDKNVTRGILRHSISSDELTAWLRDVDAGPMVIIVDACQSEATVGSGFKPGPMGSRGLGQLAYDKRIKILAASQSDEPARETSSTKHGLLTYALVNEGMVEKRADYKPKNNQILLTEWLQYAADEVPKLVVELASGHTPKGIAVTRGNDLIADSAMQKPALFDFTKAKDDLVLLEDR